MVNSLAVFGMAATAGVAGIMGSLIAMCWVERRLVDQRGPRTRRIAAKAPATRVREPRFRSVAWPRLGQQLVSGLLVLVAVVLSTLSAGWSTAGHVPAAVERSRRSAEVPRLRRARATASGSRRSRTRARPRS
ncbi:hypothetical protein [Saccharopolyspora taberi]|uniref:hypothetical protein n=1 Tax=Saccharopolyspora taberi TaxID=60895 RepID=UPI0031E179C6